MKKKIQVQNGEQSPNSPQPTRLAYSLAETAGLLGVSYITAFRLVKRGLLKSSSALRTKLISAEEIQRFLRDTAQ